MTLLGRRASLLLLLLACFAFATRAQAADPRLVVVNDARGPSGELIREAIVKALMSHAEVRVVSLAHVKKSADKLGANLGDPRGAVALGTSLGLAAIVDAEVKGQGKDWSVALRVRATSDGDIAESHQFRATSAAELAQRVGEKAWKQIGGSLADAKVPGGSSKRVVVLGLTGPKAAVVRGYVVKAVNRQKGVKVMSERDTKGQLPPKDAGAKDLAAAAEVLRASAFVGGEVKITGQAASLDVKLYNGGDGELMTEATLKGAGLQGLNRTIQNELGKKLAGPLGEAQLPPLPEEQLGGAAPAEGSGEGDAEPAEDGEAEAESPAEPRSRPGALPSALEVGLGMRAFARNYRYTDDLFGTLRAYKLGAAPAAMLWLRWYPGAHFTSGIPAHVGLAAGYEQGFGLKSEDSSGESYDTSMTEWYAGLRGRVPFDVHEAGVQVTYGKHSFRVDDDPTNPLVPNTGYEYLRVGIDGRVRVSRVSISAELGHRFVLDAGEVASRTWFPHATASGFDAGVRAGFELVSGLEVMAGFDFRRYAFDMNPKPGDANVAGGALDQYYGGWGGVSYRLDGSGE